MASGQIKYSVNFDITNIYDITYKVISPTDLYIDLPVGWSIFMLFSMIGSLTKVKSMGCWPHGSSFSHYITVQKKVVPKMEAQNLFKQYWYQNGSLKTFHETLPKWKPKNYPKKVVPKMEAQNCTASWHQNHSPQWWQWCFQGFNLVHSEYIYMYTYICEHQKVPIEWTPLDII